MSYSTCERLLRCVPYDWLLCFRSIVYRLTCSTIVQWPICGNLCSFYSFQRALVWKLDTLLQSISPNQLPSFACRDRFCNGVEACLNTHNVFSLYIFLIGLLAAKFWRMVCSRNLSVVVTKASSASSACFWRKRWKRGDWAICL